MRRGGVEDRTGDDIFITFSEDIITASKRKKKRSVYLADRTQLRIAIVGTPSL